jgi:hypothetical protein
MKTLGLNAWCTHIRLRPKAETSGTTRFVEGENDTLALAQHAENGSLKRVGREGVFGKVGVGNDDTVTRGGVVCLDDALHGGGP